jgi:hypothetical protein
MEAQERIYATYMSLIHALVDINSLEDAESVCKLLRYNSDLPYIEQPPTIGPLPLSGTNLPAIMTRGHSFQTHATGNVTCMYADAAMIPLSLATHTLVG